MVNNIAFYKGLESELPLERDSNSFYITTDTNRIILGSNTLSEVSISSGKTETEYQIMVNDNLIMKFPIIKFNIYSDIKNGELVNKTQKIEYGDTFTSEIKSKFTNVSYKNVSIIMGGVDNTSIWFDSSKGIITIPEVCGNIKITIDCSELVNSVGTIDENNNITLNDSNLSAGHTYTLRYEGESGPLKDFSIITDNAKI